MTQEEKDFCFCALALGERYRSHAFLLAEDIEKHSPGTKFVILTDKPQEFSKYSHVLAFPHQQQSIGCYHDKRFVIAKALSLFHTGIFVDVDMRILDKVAPNLKFLPGITARSCASIVKHNQAYVGSVNDLHKPKRIRDLEIVNKLAQKLDLNLEDNNTQFVMEVLFAVTRQDGREIEFLKHWETIAYYCELNGFTCAIGYAIGLAAAKAGLAVRWDAMEDIVYFKDWVERQKIKKGQAKPEESLIYFQQHEAIEFPKRSIFKKVVSRLDKTIGYYYRSLRLRLATLSNFDFYYR
ncbi:hypothetical protein [Nostoc sp. PA-18-2419]|uniref:hypothetical protein n=1 Tax=Nostoc sp. PA-18-2419 TaxID=2575443 RepID=UPI0011080C48|nr:hypothetical protein [Nostoc sp. PA-18-2419]